MKWSTADVLNEMCPSPGTDCLPLLPIYLQHIVSFHPEKSVGAMDEEEAGQDLPSTHRYYCSRSSAEVDLVI